MSHVAPRLAAVALVAGLALTGCGDSEPSAEQKMINACRDQVKGKAKTALVEFPGGEKVTTVEGANGGTTIEGEAHVGSEKLKTPFQCLADGKGSVFDVTVG